MIHRSVPLQGDDMGHVTKQKHAAASTSNDTLPAAPIERLYDALGAQGRNKIHNARTQKLLSSGLAKMSQKLVEEAAEVAIDAVRQRTGGVIAESADLLYHLVVLWHALGIEPETVWSEMNRREQLFGLAEKPPKSRS
jgi:phosphoribosyl-ATP pyrophosphohydrolase